MPNERAGACAELARRIEVLCMTGIMLRSTGWCLGCITVRDIDVVGARWMYFVPPGRMRAWWQRRQQRRHLSEGHDSGCYLLGVPEATLVKLIGNWDTVGASRLMGDVVAELMMEAAHSVERSGRWRAHDIAEAVQFCIRTRITPAPYAERPGYPQTTGTFITG